MKPEAARSAGPPDTTAAARAQQWLDEHPPPLDGLSVGQVLETGWALRQICYDAWSSQPQRAGLAAKALGQLLAEARAQAEWPLRADQELLALARWTEGIAKITTSRMDEAAATLDQAGWLFTTLEQPGHAAQTQVPRIMALTLAGRHADAAECAQRTQQEFLRLGDSRSAGKVSLNLGALQMIRDDYRSAAQLYRQAAVHFARVGDAEHSVMADIGLGNALSALGDLAEAQRIYARARMRAGTHGLPVLQAMAEEATALLDLSRGRFRDALQGLERTRRQYEALHMPQQVAIAEKQLGQAYLDLRLLPEAQQQLQRSQSAMQSLGMHDELPWVELSLARALAMTGQATLAEPLMQAAARRFETQGNQVGLASVRLALAELALATGQAAHALALADTAILTLRAQGQQDGLVRAEATAAQATLGVNGPEQARPRMQRALQMARELDLHLVQVQCLTGLGLVDLATGQAATAADHFQRAIDLFDTQRRALPCDEMRSALLADHLRPYLELLRLAMSSSQDDGHAVLQRLDHLRARALDERLLQASQPDVDAGTRDLRARLNWLYRQAGPMSGGEASPAMKAQLRRAEHELLERTRRDRMLANGPQALGTSPLDVGALQARLQPGDALVEYGVLDNELFACVVRPGHVHLLRHLASWPEVVALVRQTRFQIDALRYGSAALADHLDTLQRRVTRHLQRLHQCVWAPLSSAMQGCQRVLLVPHDELATLPFAALHDGQRSLGETLSLATAPSAHIAARLAVSSPGVPRHALALGESSRLVHASQEAQTVAALFEQGRALVDADASLERLRMHAGGCDVVHLACHAEFRRDNPMFSALHLADGPLTAEGVEHLSLAGAVVVLSGCETGLAGHPSGHELAGLVRAFLVAGARRVVASLWPVDDAATRHFMTHFYQGLCQGQEPSLALRQAQQHLRQHHPHPFHWAPFVVHGGW